MLCSITLNRQLFESTSFLHYHMYVLAQNHQHGAKDIDDETLSTWTMGFYVIYFKPPITTLLRYIYAQPPSLNLANLLRTQARWSQTPSLLDVSFTKSLFTYYHCFYNFPLLIVNPNCFSYYYTSRSVPFSLERSSQIVETNLMSRSHFHPHSRRSRYGIYDRMKDPAADDDPSVQCVCCGSHCQDPAVQTSYIRHVVH